MATHTYLLTVRKPLADIDEATTYKAIVQAVHEEAARHACAEEYDSDQWRDPELVACVQLRKKTENSLLLAFQVAAKLWLEQQQQNKEPES
jgi:hypothetical protein